MAVDRQDVGGLGQVQSRRTQVSMGSLAPDSGLEVRASNFADDLFRAASGAAKAAGMYMNDKLEDDKVKQANRALRGLVPTEDATVGGARAHMMVGAQNRVVSETARLKSQAESWQGSDAEWDNMVSQQRTKLQEDIYQQYPELANDRTTSKMITNMMLEQAPSLQLTKIGADLKREEAARLDTMNTRMIQGTQGLSGSQLSNALNGGLKDTARAMGLNDLQYDQMVSQFAKERAAQGDDSVVMATTAMKNADGVSLYDRDPSLKPAAIKARNVYAAQNEVAMADEKMSSLEQLNSGGITWDEFKGGATIQNERTGGAMWSTAEIMSVQAKYAKDQAAKGESIAINQMITNGSFIGLQDYSDKDLKGMANGYRESIIGQAQQVIDSKGLDEQEAAALLSRADNFATVQLVKQGIKDPNVDRRFTTLLNLSPEQLNNMTDEPQELTTLVQKYESLPEDMREVAFGLKESAWMNNYQRFQQDGLNVGQAMLQAKKSVTDINLSSSQRKEMNSASDSVASSVMKQSGWNPFDNLPDVVEGQIRVEANKAMQSYVNAGYPIDKAQELAEKSLNRDYTRFGNTLVKGNAEQLGQAMEVNPQDVPLQLESYLKGNKQMLEDNAGAGISIDDMYYDIDTKKGMFTIRSQGGIPVTAAQSLDKLGGYKNSDVAREGVVVNQSLKGTLNTAMRDPRFPYKDRIQTQTLMNNENPNKAGWDKNTKVFRPYDSDTGTEGTDTIGYGHYITPEERQRGYIMVGENAIPFQGADSQMTAQLAEKLLRQDMASHKPATNGWDTSFEDLPAGVQFGLQDSAFNLGKNFLSKNPTANSEFKKGDYNAGFIQLFTADSEGGKRSKGVFQRRVIAYNTAAVDQGWATVDKISVSEDGETRVRFSGDLSTISPKMRPIIDQQGWMTIKNAKAGSLHERSKAGTVDL